jgi:hypothetical protein
MNKNQEIHEELHSHDFEVYRVDHKSGQTDEPIPIKIFDDVEKAFEKVDQVSKKIGQLLRKKNSDSTIIYDSTDFGIIVIENGVKISSVLIRELEKEKVS